MSFPRRNATPAAVPTMFSLAHSEPPLDGNPGQKERFNELSTQYNKIKQENEELLQDRLQLRTENQKLRNTLLRTQEENIKLLKLVVKNSDFDKCQNDLENSQQKIKTLEIQLEHFKNKNEELTKLRKDEQEKSQNSSLMLNEEVSKLTESAKKSEKMEAKYKMLSEKLAHFAITVDVKVRDVTVGNNNIEDSELEKFIKFMTENIRALHKLVPNALSGQSNRNDNTVNDKKCSICHEKVQFAKCVTETCRKIYHEECFRQQFESERKCPNCQEASIEFNDNYDEQ